MKKYLLTALFAACCLAATTSCDDNKAEFLDEYNTILYLRNSGEIPLTLYKTGEIFDYRVIVNKAGYNLKSTASVDVGVMDQATLDAYNAANYTSYRCMPDDCFGFVGGKAMFGKSDMYDTTFKLVLYPAAIDALAPLAQGEQWVAPLHLYNGSDSINANKGVMFIIPEVLTPLIQFDVTGYHQETFSDGGPATTGMQIPVTLPIENKWDFTCTVATDQSLLDAFNAENEVDYPILPESAYTMNTTVPFTPGSATLNLGVTIYRDQLSYGNYVLPLRLTATSHPTFLINPDENKSTCLIGVGYVPEESVLSPVALTPSMITYYPTTLNEGSVAALFDDNPDTYYHSQWSPAVALPHWIQAELPATATAFKFEFGTRHNNANGAPYNVSLYGSMDNVTFSKIAVIKSGMPTTTRATYTSSVYAARPFKYFRFSVDKSGSTGGGNSFALSSFKLWTD
ncbi:MAG: DUF1735 domain-containing protein [Prevotellaceae bacterium]|jgi:hypothetical protein|nr:DUF1735 domain-containing protein [Prevotellaceae bacterium]